MWTVRGRRTALARTPRAGQRKDLVDGSTSTAHWPLEAQRVLLSGDPTGHWRRSRAGDQGTITADQSLPHDRQGSVLLSHHLGQCVSTREVRSEGEVDDTVGLCGTGAKCLQIPKIAPMGDGAGCHERLRGAVGASETEHAVAMAEEFVDDSRPDQARATRDEDVHGSLPLPDRTLVSSLYQDDGTLVPSLE